MKRSSCSLQLPGLFSSLHGLISHLYSEMRQNENSNSNYKVVDTCTFTVEKNLTIYLHAVKCRHVKNQKMKHVSSLCVVQYTFLLDAFFITLSPSQYKSLSMLRLIVHFRKKTHLSNICKQK